MNLVAPSEYELLLVIRALFEVPGRDRGGPLGAVANLLRHGRPAAAKLGPTACRLVQDSMSKGLILALMRRGGWRTAGALDDRVEVVRGRLWQRHPAPAFHISAFAVHLCRWLVSERLGGGQVAPVGHMPETAADEIILYLALDLACRARVGEALARDPAVRASALCWLGFPAEIVSALARPGGPVPADVSVYAFAPWAAGNGALALEALQPELARRWVAMEQGKHGSYGQAELIAVGRAQEAVIEAYAAAMEQAERRDLAMFLVTAAARLVHERPEGAAWFPAACAGTTLGARSGARRAQVAVLRGLRVIRRWVDEAMGVRFFDDGYEAAQLLLQQWEQLGESGYARGLAIMRQAESIHAVVGAPE